MGHRGSASRSTRWRRSSSRPCRRPIGALPVPKDGVGLTGALIDHEGSLVLTLSDGTTKALGRVKGTDGRDVDQGEVMKFLLGEIAKVPKGAEGRQGRAGRRWV